MYNETTMTSWRTILVFLAALVILLSHCNAALDPERICNIENGYTTYDSLTDCLLGVPWNETVQEQIADILFGMVDSYVFVDLSRNSPTPEFPMQVDMRKQIASVKGKIYSSDYEFQQAYAEIFTQVQDAHTRYTKPSPYVDSVYLLPLALESRVDDKQQQYLIANFSEEMANEYDRLYPKSEFNVSVASQLNGWILTSINGNNSVEHLQSITKISSKPTQVVTEFANDKIGYCKDLSARFNLAVDGYGGTFFGMFAYRQQSLLAIPETKSMNLSFSSPSRDQTASYQINWMGYYNNNATVNETEMLRKTDEDGSYIGETEIEYLKRRAEVAGFPTNSLGENLDQVSYHIINNTVGVLRVPTFSPSDENQFISTVLDGLQTFRNKGVPNLLIDLRLNGGGNICLGYALDRFLFPSITPIVGAYDMKSSDLFRAFARSGSDMMCNPRPCASDGSVSTTNCSFSRLPCSKLNFFAPCTWQEFSPNFNDQRQYSSLEWMEPGINYTRGGVAAAYSEMFSDNCEAMFKKWAPGGCSLLNGDPYKPDNIMMLSDALCGSTCAVFSRHLQLSRKAKTITIGGIAGRQPTFASFPGGEVMDYLTILDFVVQYGITQDSLPQPVPLPQPLPANAGLRLAVREIYGWTDEQINITNPLPQEFVWAPSDFHIYYEGPLADTTLIWDQAGPFFNVCASWSTLPCALPNGSGFYSCVDGKYETSSCQIASCNKNYEPMNGSCSPCPAGYIKMMDGLQDCLPCPITLPHGCTWSDNCEIECPSTSSSSKNDTTDVTLPWWGLTLIILGALLLGAMVAAGIAGMLIKVKQVRARHSTSFDYDDYEPIGN